MILPRVANEAAALLPRYIYYGNGYYGNRHSAWYRFGRWILAGILIFIGIVALLLCLCLTRRRRRRANRGTTTQAPMTYAQPPQQESSYGAPNNNINTGYAPPQGPPPAHYGGGGANADYYGQQTGVAPPAGVYQPGK